MWQNVGGRVEGRDIARVRQQAGSAGVAFFDGGAMMKIPLQFRFPKQIFIVCRAVLCSPFPVKASIGSLVYWGGCGSG